MLTLDVENIFFHLASQSRLPKLRQLVLAPLQLHRKMVEMIEALGVAAASGKDTRLIAKMNALTDEGLMRALIKAGQQGVKIDLIVRGACMLPAQVPGLTENIRVRSVIGRFLEHSRVFYFRAGDEETLYLSSADWMNRNMFGRIELAWPVTDPVLRQRIIDECLVAYLHDTQDAWELLADGTYKRTALLPRSRQQSAQVALMARYSSEPKRLPLKRLKRTKSVKSQKPAAGN
jgi:polyphosphate kinase